MATEKYNSVKTDFMDEFGINFDIDAYQTLRHKVKSMGIFIYDKNKASERVNLYVNTLYTALMLYMEDKTRMGDGQYYDLLPPTNYTLPDIPNKYNKLYSLTNKSYNQNIPHQTAVLHKPLQHNFHPLPTHILHYIPKISVFRHILHNHHFPDIPQDYTLPHTIYQDKIRHYH